MSDSAETKLSKWAEMKTPWPNTREELIGLIDSIVSSPMDYNDAPEAIAVAMAAVTNFFGSTLGGGCTGFQVSFATLRGFGRIRDLQCPFAVIKAEDMLFPQYDIKNDVDELIEEWRPWAKAEAAKKLTEDDKEYVHPEVWKHWEELANWEPELNESEAASE